MNVNPKYCYGALLVFVLAIAALLNTSGITRNIYLLSLFLFPASFTTVYITAGKVFFYDKKKSGTYNLLYIWSILAGALIVFGADTLNSHSLLRIVLCSLGTSFVVVMLTYILLKKFWNGKDSLISVFVASIFICFGLVLNVIRSLG